MLLGVIPLDDFDFYLRKQMPEGRPRIERYNPPRSDRQWIRGRASEVVVVKNRYWSNGVDRVIEELKKDDRLAFTTVVTFKGIELHRFVPTDAPHAPSNREGKSLMLETEQTTGDAFLDPAIDRTEIQTVRSPTRRRSCCPGTAA